MCWSKHSEYKGKTVLVESCEKVNREINDTAEDFVVPTSSVADVDPDTIGASGSGEVGKFITAKSSSIYNESDFREANFVGSQKYKVIYFCNRCCKEPTTAAANVASEKPSIATQIETAPNKWQTSHFLPTLCKPE
ncbi:hypothetical protein VNO80_24448 [Phaseolus coccineus]|uniref:Uncharacterized protein n=1 Tax=Phaseolus coccineus TaxID=3886 RepID=A0AAN9LSU7_PHACN